MALIGFPEIIEVRCGNACNSIPGSNWSAGQHFKLFKVSGQDIWTENGTDVPGSGNGVRFRPISSGGLAKIILSLGINTGTSYQWAPGTDAGTYSAHSAWTTKADYTFKDLFDQSTALTQMAWSATYRNFSTGWYYTPSYYNPQIFDFMEEAILGDDIESSPEQIQVTLGSAFQGGGFGLNEKDVITLQRSLNPISTPPPRRDPYIWSEDGTDTPSATPPYNRIVWKPSQVWVVGSLASHGGELDLLRSGGTLWREVISVYASARGTAVTQSNVPYEFKDLWNLTTTPTWATSWYTSYNTGRIAPSWGFTSGMKFNPDVFKSMEAYSVRGPDKTTYRYG